jgi:SpoIIAA-like
VTDIDWMRHLTELFGWMTPGEVKVFPLAQRGAAIAWAAGSGGAGTRPRTVRPE